MSTHGYAHSDARTQTIHKSKTFLKKMSRAFILLDNSQLRKSPVLFVSVSIFVSKNPLEISSCERNVQNELHLIMSIIQGWLPDC